MKTLKSGILFLSITFLAMSISFSQEEEKKENKNKMLNVHIDNVKFDKMMDYEQAAKDFKENCEKYNIQNFDYSAISTEDGRYIFVSEIESMADLDKNPMSSLYEKMGEEAFADLFDRMDQCYDSHGNHISHYIDSLSYHPENETASDDNNYLEYHFLYYYPRNGDAIFEAMKAVKETYAAKNVKNGYNVYHSGFGSDENYFIVVVNGKSGLDIAQRGEENDKALGEDIKPKLFDVIKLTSKYDQVDARYRPDLSYYATKN